MTMITMTTMKIATGKGQSEVIDRKIAPGLIKDRKPHINRNSHPTEIPDGPYLESETGKL